MWYVYNKHVLFFVRSSIKYVFWITRFPSCPCGPAPTPRTIDSPLCFRRSVKLSYAAYVIAGVSGAPLL